MDSELAFLASAAATALVGLMVTDSWDTCKAAIVSLWRRSRPERAVTVDSELSASRLELIEAREAQDEQAEADLVRAWSGRFAELVADQPGLAADLRRLVHEFRLDLARRLDVPPSVVTMEAKASGHGRVYQAGRDQQIREQ